MRYLALLVVLVQMAQAANWYVSPTGSGDGSLESPWPITQGLTNATIVGGDTVWLLPGVYARTNTITLSGTDTNNVITYRALTPYTAKLNGPITSGLKTNIWLRDLEIYDSNKTNHTAPFNTVAMQPGGNAIINCLIHDCNIGIAPHGPDLIYGNILWNCGINDGLEHGMYLQNETYQPSKLVANNLIGRTYGFGIQAYGSAGGMDSMHFLNNAIWQSAKFNFLFGGGIPITDGSVIGNHTAFGGGGLKIGNSVDNTDAIVADNFFCEEGLAVLYPLQFVTYTFTNNLIRTGYYYALYAGGLSSLTGTLDWDRNTYYKHDFGSDREYMFNLNLTDYTNKAAWVAASGVDANSTVYTNRTPAKISTDVPPDSVHVYTNLYTAKRAHIVVWNWSQSDNASADISTVLASGDQYVVRSALNYPYGPILTNTYTGGAISLPMTNLTFAAPLYWEDPDPPRTDISTNFGAFVLEQYIPPTGNTIRATTTRVTTLRGR